MSWLKAAGQYANNAIKKADDALKAAATAAAATAVGPDTKSTRAILKDHVTYIRSFADAMLGKERHSDYDKLALNYRLPEELDSMMQLLEAENAFAQHMREDPSKGPCTMYFLEDNVMEMLFQLMQLDHSVALQKCVIKTVIRALRLRYELLDNGSVARLVMQMAERLEYSPMRAQYALTHCEFLYALCDKVQRNPAALLPVVVSKNVNTGGMGHEFLLLNWSIQHFQDPAGGEYAQRGILSLLQISDQRVTEAVCSHSGLIERTVRMVDLGFHSALREIDANQGAMDEVGSKRNKPDPAPFYAAMRFVDNVVKVAEGKVAAQLLEVLDANFLRQTLRKRLMVGSEVQHVGVMEIVRGLFEPDPLLMSQNPPRNGRRLQQPQLISLIAKVLVGVPSSARGDGSPTPTEGEGGGLLSTLIERVDSMNDEESVAALHLFASLVDIHDEKVMAMLVGPTLARPEVAAAVQAELQRPKGCAEAIDSLEERMQEAMKGLVKLAPPEGLDEYQKDAIRVVSVCFRCCELWLGVEGAAAPVEGARSFVDVILAKLSSFFRNSLQVNLVLTGIIAKLITYPSPAQHLFFTSQAVAAKLPPNILSLHRVIEKLDKDAASRMASVEDGEGKLRAAREGCAKALSKAASGDDDIDDAKEQHLLQTVVVLLELRLELLCRMQAKRQCCLAWKLYGMGR
mmetsp:Transcript_55925/g.131679  ORF Transcript_55925/g.131679 Transcript_55925/m.131679 type:complete len:686 (-) Transcript_55925:315-2372(-)